MTAEPPAPQAPDATTAEPARTERDRRRARRIEGWSIVWVLLALMIWLGFLFLMLADYGPEYSGRAMCRGPLVDLETDRYRCRDAWREWPALMGVLALASLTTVIAAATTVYAKVLTRLTPQDTPGPGSGPA
ncbi:hypothetical protein [Streptomyces sp. NPDC059134]|uniref:hypothetical protein n=1 Tax=Streptomyces sp. NPDC059134 TaxID=3346738 RepID=UPI003679C474